MYVETELNILGAGAGGLDTGKGEPEEKGNGRATKITTKEGGITEGVTAPEEEGEEREREELVNNVGQVDKRSSRSGCGREGVESRWFMSSRAIR